MAIFENEEGLTLFGIEILKPKTKDTNSAALAAPLDDEGAALSYSTGAASLGVYLDIDAQSKSEFQAIQKYREISLFAEVDQAIQDIVNEAIPMEQVTPLAELNCDELEVKDSVKDKFRDEFKTVLNLFSYRDMAADMFRRWYVDGRLFYQIIIDKENPKDGIQELIPLDALKIKKVKEITKKRTEMGVDAIDKIDEYFVYNATGFVSQSGASNPVSSTSQGVKISPDAIVYCPSGFVDQTNGTVLSYLNKAIRPINQLRMLEDATVIYFIARAPERRVFYVDVGNLPKLKAEQYLKDIMNRYRNKMVYDAKTGDVRDDKKYMSMLEDFWMPRREGGKGTEITSLPGAQNITGYLDSLEWFKEKMYEALNVPKSRMQGQEGFSLGRSSEITRDELKFQKYINRLKTKFSTILLDALRIQLVLKGICSTEEWEDIKNEIKVDLQTDNYFEEFKNQDIWQSRVAMLPQVDLYLQKYFSKEWVQKTILRMSDEEIEIENQRMQSEANDPTARPPNPFTGDQGSNASDDFNAQNQQNMQMQAQAMGGGQPPDANGAPPANGAQQ